MHQALSPQDVLAITDSQLHAELALGGGLERLTEPEHASIDEGRAFEALFNGANNVQQLPWRLPGATCEIAHVDGDPDPWCRCAITLPAAAEAVLEALWKVEGKRMDYHERVKFRVLDRPNAHGVNLALCIGVVPMMPPFEWRLTATWSKFGAAGAEGYVLAILPSSGLMANQDADSNAASALHLILLRPGARANTTDWTYLFQIDLGSHVHA
jgi:hypothetical protein